MSTSDKMPLNRNAQLKTHLMFNVAGTIFLALFGAIYELFSHGVYSYHMIYAFGFPLIMGVLLYAVLILRGKYPRRSFLNVWNTAIATFSLGSVFEGVLEIYGTSNPLVIVYPIAGGILLIIGLIMLARQMRLFSV